MHLTSYQHRLELTFTVPHICEHRSAGKHFLQISGTHCLLFVFTFTKRIFLLGILARGNLGRHISQGQQKKITYIQYIRIFPLNVNTHASEAVAVKYNPETV